MIAIPTTTEVQLTDVWRTFGEDPPIHALRGVDLSIGAGEWLAIVGPSGSGKSTLLNVIGCLDRPTAGRLELRGQDVGQLDDGDRANIRARELGFVFQSFHLLAHRTVLENVMLAEVYRGEPRRGRRERAAEELQRVGLGGRVDYLPTRLSGGERQRVAVARALLGRPHVLLADEPTGNLDSVTTGSIMQLLADLHASGITIVMITHSETVARAAQRQVTMVDGTLAEVC